MADFYRKTIQITTAGLTGNFIGFQNTNGSAQNVTIRGNGIYDISGAITPLTINVAAGAIVPVACSGITPETNTIIGFLYP